MYATKEDVVNGIKARFERGDSLKYTPTQRDDSSLYSACIKHFGNYRTAISAAGFNYDSITGKRSWDADKVLTEIQRIHAEGWKLNPQFINKNYGALYRQAFNFFGSWKAAVEQSLGVDYEELIAKVSWTSELILERIKQRVEQGKSLTTISLIKESEKALLDAGSRYFGDWESAVEAAGYDYAEVLAEGNRSRSELCTKNTEEDIKEFITSRFSEGLPLNSGYIDTAYRTYMKSACYRFGSWRRAVEACGIDYIEVAVDSTIASRAGHMFEEMVADLLTELQIEYTRDSGCKWRPDFVINKNYWIDAKLSTWTSSIPSTIEKYEPFVRRLSIVYFRGDKRSHRIRTLTKKTDMIPVELLISYLPTNERQTHYLDRCANIDKLLK